MNKWLEHHISLISYKDPFDEKLNAHSHFIGGYLAIAGLMLVLMMRDLYTSRATEIGMLVFATTNILLYFASGFYHYLEPGNGKRFCRIMDHMNIYILIAGSYTPILLYIDTPKAIGILVAIWSLMVIGTILTVAFWGKLRIAHVVLYFIMGWLCVFFAKDIFPLLPAGLPKWMLMGGITYSVGIIFYGGKKIPHHHFIWHIFTMLGSLFFYAGYLIYLR